MTAGVFRTVFPRTAALACMLAGACMLIAGCSAPNVSDRIEVAGENQQGSTPISVDAMPARKIVMPGYTLELPQEFAQGYRFVVNGGSEPSGSLWIGNGVDVRTLDSDRVVFFVACCSDDWGPQGMLYTKKVGPLSTVPGSSVYVGQARVDAQGVAIDNLVEEYASFIRLAPVDERVHVFETPYYTIQLPADLAQTCVIEYDDYARVEDDGSGEIGHTTSVRDAQTGESIFFVVCASNAFVPDEGQPYVEKLEAPSQLPDTNVYVAQQMFGANDAKSSDETATYATYATVL